MKAILELEMPKSCSECPIDDLCLFNEDIDNEEFNKINIHNERLPQCPLQSIVPNEEVLKELELFGAFAIKNAFNEKEINSLMKKYDLIKQALTTPKISEEGKFGSGHHKLFVKNKKYKQLLDKVEIKREGLKFYVKGICYEEEISSYLYHDIKELKSIGGNK